MPGQNLTRDEARERSALLSVDSYDIDLDLTEGAATFLSTVSLRFTAAEAGASTSLDLLAPAVREVVLNGRQIDPADAFDGTGTLDQLLRAPTAYLNAPLAKFYGITPAGASLSAQAETVTMAEIDKDRINRIRIPRRGCKVQTRDL